MPRNIIKVEYDVDGVLEEGFVEIPEHELEPWGPSYKAKVMGQPLVRVDGYDRVTGKAKYTYDITLPGMLFGRVLRCPSAHARIKKIDVSKAAALPGVHAVISSHEATGQEAAVFRRELDYAGQMVASAVMLTIAGALMSAVVATAKPLVNQVLLPAGDSVESAPAPSRGPDILETIRDWVPVQDLSFLAGERAFLQVPLLIIVVFFVRGVFLYFGEYLATRSGTSVIRDLRAELYESVAHQSRAFFDTHPTGLILSRILSDVQRLQRVSTRLLADLVRILAMVPFLLVVVLLHDWRTSLLSMIALPALGYPLVRLGRRLRRASTRSQERMADVTSLVTESVGGIEVVQGFGREEYEVGRFRAALDRMLGADLKAGRAAALSPAVMELCGAIAGGALFWFAGMQIAQGRLDRGDFVVVLTGLGLLYMSLRRLNQLYVEFQQALAAADRVFRMLDREREIRDAPSARPLERFERRVVYEDVEFTYGDEKVLDRVRLTLDKGEVVALVGPSGSGKTTLAKLLPRFYDPTGGCIRIDGRDIREITLGSLRERIGLVTQETVLFDDTVRNNIAYGRDDAPLDRVIEVARAAQAHEFIEKLPQGYETRLGERGTRLSMGQRQRITIARALLKDAPMLILDEATSALDAESEALVQQALEALMRGRTSIVIAHRLSTVRRADQIVVLESGRIVEQGTHRELLAARGAYARVYELQFRESA